MGKTSAGAIGAEHRTPLPPLLVPPACSAPSPPPSPKFAPSLAPSVAAPPAAIGAGRDEVLAEALRALSELREAHNRALQSIADKIASASGAPIAEPPPKDRHIQQNLQEMQPKAVQPMELDGRPQLQVNTEQLELAPKPQQNPCSPVRQQVSPTRARPPVPARPSPLTQQLQLLQLSQGQLKMVDNRFAKPNAGQSSSGSFEEWQQKRQERRQQMRTQRVNSFPRPTTGWETVTPEIDVPMKQSGDMLTPGSHDGFAPGPLNNRAHSLEKVEEDGAEELFTSVREADSEDSADMLRARAAYRRSDTQLVAGISSSFFFEDDNDDHMLLDKSSACLQRATVSLLKSRFFEYSMALIICVNSVCIGIQADWALQGRSTKVLQIMEHAFLGIYVVEIFIRLFARRLANFRDGWFRFDLALVVAGVLMGWVLEPLLAGIPSALSQVVVLRVLRVFRLIRALRMIDGFRTIWRLIYGLMSSGSMMISTFALLLLAIYIFAIVSLEVVTKDSQLRDDPLASQILEKHFSSIGVTMLTFMRFVSMDDCAQIYMPLVLLRPQLVVFFALIIIVLSVSIVNLVMAVLVEGALSQASSDKEMKRYILQNKLRSAAPILVSLFSDLDTNDDGFVQREEVMEVTLDVLPAEVRQVVAATNFVDLFDILDEGSSGQLSPEEFVGGILTMVCSDEPAINIQMMKLVKLTREKAMTTEDLVHTLIGDVAELRSELLNRSAPPAHWPFF